MENLKQLLPIGAKIKVNNFAGRELIMKLEDIIYLEKEQTYSYKFKKGNSTQYYLQEALNKELNK